MKHSAAGSAGMARNGKRRIGRKRSSGTKKSPRVHSLMRPWTLRCVAADGSKNRYALKSYAHIAR
jgi:hypothetical protein